MSSQNYQMTHSSKQRKGDRDNLLKESELVAEINKLNKTLELFTYSTAHDLRAPLTTLMGLINLLESEVDGSDSKTYLNMMRNIIGHQDFFIHNITDLLRNARTKIKRESIDLDEFIHSTFKKLDYLDEWKTVVKTVKVNYHYPSFFSDSSRLGIILHNLLSNAAKFQREKKHKISVNAIVKKNELALTVSDNGTGIAREHKDHIFEIFFRAAEKKTGAGLGLYIVKETVQTMNGEIKLQSQQGRGANFTVKLPNLH